MVIRFPFSCSQSQNAVERVPFVVHRQEWEEDRTEGVEPSSPFRGAAATSTGTGTSGLSPLGLCLAVPDKTVRWCTISNQEASKCSSFRDSMKKVLPETGPLVTCVKKTSSLECIKAIMVSRCCLKESGRRPYFLMVLVLDQFCTHM